MTSFLSIAHIDTWAFSAWLRSKLSLFSEEPFSGVAIRDQDGQWHKEAREWRSLQSLLLRLQRLPAAVDMDLGLVELIQLRPRAETPWGDVHEHPEGWSRAHLPIITNPMCGVFCGIVWQHLPVGALTVVNYALPVCVVNWGEQPAFYLTVEFRRKLLEPEDQA